jgi:DNA-binding Xre family transcriptional regulator
LLDDFLRKEGILDDALAAAVRRMIAWQIEQTMKDSRLSRRQMADEIDVSQTELKRLLDRDGPAVRLETLQRAAVYLGRGLRVALR